MIADLTERNCGHFGHFGGNQQVIVKFDKDNEDDIEMIR